MWLVIKTAGALAHRPFKLFRYPRLFLKQSIHFKLLVLRGVKGSEVIAPPHSAHFQSPATLVFSPGVAGVAPPKSSAGAGSPAKPASSGISGASLAAGMSGACSFSRSLPLA